MMSLQSQLTQYAAYHRDPRNMATHFIGVPMTVLAVAILLFHLWLATRIAGQGDVAWLGGGIGLFVIGWAFQFVGRYHEGRKPAFVDDIMGLPIAPLFVATPGTTATPR